MYLNAKFNISKDARLIGSLIRTKLAFGAAEKSDTVNVTYRFDECYHKNPDREAMVFEGKSFTYRDIYRGKLQSCQAVKSSSPRLRLAAIERACVVLPAFPLSTTKKVMRPLHGEALRLHDRSYFPRSCSKFSRL